MSKLAELNGALDESRVVVRAVYKFNGKWRGSVAVRAPSLPELGKNVEYAEKTLDMHGFEVYKTGKVNKGHGEYVVNLYFEEKTR